MPNSNRNSHDSITFILGAGFSKNAGIPLQSEFSDRLILYDSDNEIDILITDAIKDYLSRTFGWKDGLDLPSLEDMFTCIDLSAASGHHLGISYTPKKLRALRRMLIYRTFSILDQSFNFSPGIEALLKKFCNFNNRDLTCNFVLLNWDIVLEKHLAKLKENIKINYCAQCYDWNDPSLYSKPDGVPICKMHGSANWVYCDNCKSMFFDLGEKLSLRLRAGLIKSDFRLFDEGFTDKKFDEAISIPPRIRECRFCKNIVSPHIETFSYRKSFRTPAYSSIWHDAENFLSDSSRWIFIGYSLPEADYEFKHLLKSAQLKKSHLSSIRNKSIEAVALNDEQVHRKFKKFFGYKLGRFYNDGLNDLISNLD